MDAMRKEVMVPILAQSAIESAIAEILGRNSNSMTREAYQIAEKRLEEIMRPARLNPLVDAWDSFQ